MRERWLLVACGLAGCAVEGSISITGAWEEDGTAGDESTSSGTTGGDATSTTAVDESGDVSSSTGGEPPPSGPTFYPADRVHSPITASVATGLRTLADTAPELADDVFLKAGASSDVNTNNLTCFAGDAVDLGEHEDLADTLAFFLAADAAGSTPFDRTSAATEVGRTAAWAIADDPSPLGIEIEALSPRLAFVHFGTNDMELGVTPLTALPGFYEAMSGLLDVLEGRGIVPIVVGLTRRGDDPDADRFIATYNAVLRGMAQARQVPFVDAHLAIDPLAGHGLGPDGLHLEAYDEGACVLDALGLAHGYNVRNLIQLEVLARARAVLVEEVEAIDDPTPEIAAAPGMGTADDPIVVDRLPFADARDTTVDGATAIDAYPGCSDSDESGREVVYAIAPDSETAVRIVVLDRVGADVDVHLLGDAVDGEGCIARDDTAIATTLAPGPAHVVVDTWSDGARPLAGPYLLVVVPCDAGDPDCAG